MTAGVRMSAAHHTRCNHWVRVPLRQRSSAGLWEGLSISANADEFWQPSGTVDSLRTARDGEEWLGAAARLWDRVFTGSVCHFFTLLSLQLTRSEKNAVTPEFNETPCWTENKSPPKIKGHKRCCDVTSPNLSHADSRKRFLFLVAELKWKNFPSKRRVLRGLRRELPRRAVEDQIQPALRPLEWPQQQVGYNRPTTFPLMCGKKKTPEHVNIWRGEHEIQMFPLCRFYDWGLFSQYNTENMIRIPFIIHNKERY